MPENEVFLALRRILQVNSHLIAEDLEQVATQQVNTTKHGRRQRTLSYLLESLTGGEAGALEMHRLLDALIANTKDQEARVGLERSLRRVRWLLGHPEELRGTERCIACGDLFPSGERCPCNSTAAKSRDAAMTRDDLIS